VTAELDHVVIATRDLQASIERYRRLGFHVAYGGKHPGNGTSNAIMRFGLDYLELLGVDRRVAGRRARGRELVAFVESSGGGLINFCLRGGGAIDAARRGVPGTPPPQPLQRQLPGGGKMRWRMLLPGGSNCRRPWPFFIDWETPDAERLEMEPPGHHPNGAVSLAGVVIGGWLPDALAGLYDSIGLAPEASGPVRGVGVETRRVALAGSAVELATPTSLTSRLAARLAAWGEGPYAVAIAVDSLAETAGWLVANGVPHAATRRGIVVDPDVADGALLAFVPRRTRGRGGWAALFEHHGTGDARASRTA
jgi:catechol 2,3-dioxygenase-like lactoylglutathione lyase family enzyme